MTAPQPPTTWFFFFNDTATTEIYTLSLHDALPISYRSSWPNGRAWSLATSSPTAPPTREKRSEEHTSELQSQSNLVCRLLLEKKKKTAEEPRTLRAATRFCTATLSCLRSHISQHVP